MVCFMISGRSVLRIRINKLSCAVVEARKLLQSRPSKRKACNSVISCRRGICNTLWFALYNVFFYVIIAYVKKNWWYMCRLAGGYVHFHDVVSVKIGRAFMYVYYIFWVVQSWRISYLRDCFNMHRKHHAEKEGRCHRSPFFHLQTRAVQEHKARGVYEYRLGREHSAKGYRQTSPQEGYACWSQVHQDRQVCRPVVWLPTPGGNGGRLARWLVWSRHPGQAQENRRYQA